MRKRAGAMLFISSTRKNFFSQYQEKTSSAIIRKNLTAQVFYPYPAA